MKVELLADHPGLVETIGRWYWDEWGEVAGESLEDSIERTRTFMSREGPPMIVLARDDQNGDDGEWLGAAQLKVREMSICPQFECWLGGVYVPESARGRGVGARLVDAVLSQARTVGIERLYLQTERLDGGMYRRHGFEPVEETVYNDVRVLVMTATVGTAGAGT